MHERNTLLILFRFTARLSTFFLTKNANLLSVLPFFAIFTANRGVLKKEEFFSWESAGNRYSLLNIET